MKTAPPRPTRPLSRVLALPLALTLALTLGGCGAAEESAATPAPETAPRPAPRPTPEVWTSRALNADGPPTVTGVGTYAEGVFEKAPSYESCTSPRPEGCLSWTVALPAPPPGQHLQVLVGGPLLAAGGQSVSFTPEGQAPCTEVFGALTMYGFGPAPRLQGLTADPLAVPPGTDRLSVAVCFFGAVRAQVGALTGTMTFARWQPLHR